MKASAKLNYLRVSPRKVRLVANLIRGMHAGEAQVQLSYLNKRAALPLLKLLNSAVRNAEHNMHLDAGSLYISKLLVNEGPKLKRFRPRAMGRAFPILKRTSHVILELADKGSGKNTKGRRKKDEKAETPIGVSPDSRETSKETSPADAESKIKKEEVSPLRKQPRGTWKDERAPKKTSGFVKKIFRRKSI